MFKLNRPLALAGQALAATVLIVAAAAVQAQAAYPAKPVKIVVPYPPGGAVDQVTRRIAQKLTEQTGQSFFVENKAGATGTIGAMQVARSPGDGYTLLANDTTYSILPQVFKKLPWDYAQDLVPVAGFNFAPTAVVVAANSPFKTLGDMVAYSQANPGKLNYGTGGAGTMPHFATEALQGASGLKATHVPFKGAGEATLALLGGTIDFQIASTPGVMGQVRGGKVRLLAVSGEQRLKALPNVPTFAQAGAPGYKVVNFTGLWAPKGTPEAVLETLRKEVVKAMASADVQAFADDLGAVPGVVSGPAFADKLKADAQLWEAVAAKVGVEKQ
ncbi:tripartite tricarboxylate transporter substrate binding protein [Diaphorobacter sp. C33]|uniref:Tripartite-type tricarboxylate transporter receptor subunit TctC n=1 Tax=Diaphorobacter nitroreducens TaxID=164759 RepID=A0AAX1WWF0_9BURK|nr:MULTISPECIES: tripartite tricarboxylate transporter substrate binding protein [Diaphorobacter]ROR48891.1 tripartite-type tricarboxylate transporter receptor subunit TctC [Diaphorobacter nitroreducens]WKK89135.1 tripartite tricarboxylate transporter substrate binding protein [Diaphorobacter sp. C33]